LKGRISHIHEIPLDVIKRMLCGWF